MAQRMRLTDRSAAKLSVERSEYTVWDTRMAGLGVRVRPRGTGPGFTSTTAVARPQGTRSDL